MELALSKFCGEADIITPISPRDEKIRRRLGYRGPQNYRLHPPDDASGGAPHTLVQRPKAPHLFNHSPARQVRAWVGEHVWNRYYKFCFERNPWDRVISLYCWRFGSKPTVTLSEFIDSDLLFNLKKRGIRLYTIHGEIAVDKVCLYESLTEELEHLQVRLGFPERLCLPRAKSGFRKDRRSYREILNEAQRTRIEALFREEISLFGYQF